MDTRRRRALIESFEPRIMYSADPGPAGLAAALLTAAEVQVDGGGQLQGAGTELVFVDARTPELQLLLDDLAAQQQAGRPIEVVVIGGDEDGIAVVGQHLAGRSDVTAIHLVGHGTAGVAELGASRLDAESLVLRAGEISAWGDALTGEADLLLYGCDVASTAAGEGLVDALAALTGADVAASDDLTGATALGGDWNLEYRSGNIETTLAPGVAAQQAWGGVLAITTGTVSSASSIGTQMQRFSWSHTVADGSNRALFVEVAIANTGTTVSSVTYGGVALTLVGRATGNDVVLPVEIWRLSDPVVGTAEVVVNLSADTAVAAGATTYNGVHQTSPVGSFYAAAGTGTTSSVTVPDSQAGDLVIDVQAWRGQPTVGALGAGQESNWLEPNTNLTGRSTREPGAPSVVMSGSITSSATDWTIGAVAIRPSAVINSAPVLEAAKSPALAAMLEDAGAPSGAVGSLVSSLVDFAAPAGQVDNVTDADGGALLGIAVTATNTSAGKWFYSVNDGGSWLEMGSVSEASARLLSADVGTRLYFQPNANWNGTLANAITFRAWDRSSGANGELADTTVNGGVTAFSSASDTASLTVSAVNDAPVITFVSGNATYSENDGAVVVAPNATVSDVDSADFNGGRLEVYFSANGQPEDRIGIRNEGAGAGQIGVSGSNVTYGGVVIGTWTGGTDGAALVVSFNTSATPAVAQALGRNITYQNVSDNPSTFVRTMVGFLVDGDGGTSNTVGGTLTIQPANDAPVATISPASYTATEQVAVTLSGTGISISDVDAGTAGIHVTLSVVSGTLSGVEGTTGVRLARSGTASVTLDGTQAQINAFLAGDSGASLSYLIDTDTPPASDTLTLTVDDLGYSGGPAQSGTDTATIDITAVNDAPVNHIPGVQVTPLDTDLVMSAATGNGLSITDPDAGSGLMRVALTATSGTLTLGPTAGLSSVSGDGTASVSATGTLDAINTALNGLRYKPVNGQTGLASFVVETSDEGNTGGGARTDTDTIYVKVGASRYQQDVDGYSGTEDTYVSDGAPSIGHGDATTVVTDDGSPVVQGLLRFGNLFGSGAGQIPNGALINSVALSFYVTSIDANDSLSIYRMLSAWDESSTWNSLGSGVSLNGVEAAGSADVANWNSGISGWNTITSGLTATVQAWANGTANNGWVFEAPSGTADKWAFASSEDSTLSRRPYLVISYTPPAPPVITSNGGADTASVDVAENTTTVTTVTATDADSVPGALSYSIVGGADRDQFQIDSSGVLSFKAAPNYESPNDIGANWVYNVTVQVSDGFVTDTQDIAVTVTAVNEAPTFSGFVGSVSYTEGGSATVLAGAAMLSDPELLAVNSFDGATLTLVRSGGANSDDIFSATGKLAALTVGQSLVLDGVVMGTVSANAGGTLSLSFNTNATQERVNGVIQSIAYANSSDAPPASVQISWTFSDGNAGSQGAGSALTAAGSTTVNITAVNDPAVISGTASASLTESDAVQSTGDTLDVSDVDSPASFVAQSGVAGSNGYGDFSIASNGIWSYTMRTAHDEFDAGVTYTDSFTATTADGTKQIVTVSITGSNDVARLTSETQALTETDAVLSTSGTLTLTDADATAATVIAQTDVAGTYGRFSINASGAWTYTTTSALDTLDASQVVSDVFDVATSDGGSATVTVSITGSNDVARLTSETQALTETDAVLSTSGTLTLTDADATAATVTAQTDVAGTYGRFSINASGAWTYTSNGALDLLDAGQMVSDVFDVATSDGGSATVTVTITGSNDVARLTSDTKSLTETDAPLSTSGTLTLTDADATAATVTAQTNVAGTYGRFSINASGAWTYTSNGALDLLDAGQVVSDVFDVATSDGGSATVTVSITGSNDVARLSGDTKSLTETDAVLSTIGTLTLTDPDATAATVIAQTDVAGTYGRFSINASGAWSYTTTSALDLLDAGQMVSDVFDVATSDGGSAKVTITLTGSNDAPTLATPSADQKANEDSAFSFTLPANSFADVDAGDSLSYSATGLPTWLSFDPATRIFSGTPTNVGSTTITVTATDGSNATASDSFVLTVTNTNDPPIALADTVSTAEDTPVSFDPVANDSDADGDGLTLASVTQGAHGRVSLVDGAILYTPDADFHGADSFSYVVTDGQGGSATAMISVTVTPVDDLPLAVEDALAIAEGGVLTGSVAGNDSPSGDGGNVWSLVTGPSHGSLVLASDGSFRYTPDPDFHGRDSFTYALTDADGDSATAIAAIVVTPINDTPVMAGGDAVALSVAENTTAVTTLSASDGDRPAQALSYSIVGGADRALFAVDAASGALRFIAPPDFELPRDADGNNVYELVVQVSDGLATASQTLAVTVGNRNEMPQGSDGRIGMDEDGSYRFTLADFGFRDARDSSANSLAAVQVVALPGQGVLQLAGRAVKAGEWVAAGDIAAGRLTYQPVPDANGQDYAALAFRVRDDGGTADNGIDTEAGTHTLWIDVAAVNDAPVINRVTLEQPEGAQVVLGAGAIVVSDEDSALASLRYAVDAAAGGHFELLDRPGEVITTFSQAELLAGRVVFVRDVAQTTAVVVIRASDGEANSGAVSATITIQASAPGASTGPAVTPPAPPVSTVTPVVTNPVEAEQTTTAPTTTPTTAPSKINRPSLPASLAPAIDPVSPADGPLTLTRDGAGNVDLASRVRNQTVGGPTRLERVSLQLSLGDGLDGPLLDFMLRGDGLVFTNATGSSDGLRGGDDNPREGVQGRDGDVDVRVVLQAIELTGVALSVGAVWWATRAGALVASLLMSVPAWRSFDPLMVLGPEDEDDHDWAGVMDDQALQEEMGIAEVFDAGVEAQP